MRSAAAGPDRCSEKVYPRGAGELVDQLLVALGEQSVVVPGTAAAETVLPKLAASLRDTLDHGRPSPPKWNRSSMPTLLPTS